MPVLQLNQNRLSVVYDTMEEYLLWNYLNSIAGITLIEPLVYQGVIAGSEFLTYAATKVYLSLDFDASYSSASANNLSGLVTFYNIANAIDFYYAQSQPVYNTTTPIMQYCLQNVNKKLIIFSRVVFTTYSYLHFVGYRITI